MYKEHTNSSKSVMEFSSNFTKPVKYSCVFTAFRNSFRTIFFDLPKKVVIACEGIHEKKRAVIRTDFSSSLISMEPILNILRDLPVPKSM